MTVRAIAILLGGVFLASAPKKDEVEAVKPAFLEACAKHCERKHAMQAVSAQMILAQCEDACRADWAQPLVRTSAELKKHENKRVRVEGTLSDRSPSDLVLKDG